MRRDGLIRHVGLSNVSVEDIEAARPYFPVATVQNRYNLADRSSEDVLTTCERQNIGFIPWAPLSAGTLAGLVPCSPRSPTACMCLPASWHSPGCLKRSPVMLPIPGTANPDHLAQNLAAAGVALSDADFQALDRQGREAWRQDSHAG